VTLEAREEPGLGEPARGRQGAGSAH
jgi:hypothetical protein